MKRRRRTGRRSASRSCRTGRRQHQRPRTAAERSGRPARADDASEAAALAAPSNPPALSPRRCRGKRLSMRPARRRLHAGFLSAVRSDQVAAAGDDLRAWFGVPGHNLRLNKVDTRSGVWRALEGMARLKSPWPDGGVLRLSLENYNRLNCTSFTRGGRLVIYYEDQNYRWVAYATTREAGKSNPKTWAITGTDDDRCRRSENAPRGTDRAARPAGGSDPQPRRHRALDRAAARSADGRVFRRPGRLPGHRAAADERRCQRCLRLPIPSSWKIDRPADLPWKAIQAETAPPELLADGGVRFVADEAKLHANYARRCRCTVCTRSSWSWMS